MADHDFSRGSITPSVTLNIDIPTEPVESFYHGKVTVTLKDSVFQASDPFRHAAETSMLLERRYGDSVPPILCMYSDGGADHRCNFISVIYTMVYLFIEHDLDFLILARNAPGHSWRNPAERIMALLNLGLQGVGVMRTEATDKEIENQIKK